MENSETTCTYWGVEIVCGICGIVRFDGKAIERSVVEDMTRTMAHRGPDDEGTWFGGKYPVHAGLGSRRLSVIDLSPRGHMPMSNREGTLWISYNGEVYNFQEIRKKLQACGHQFRSDTDTEVILQAYEQWGPACLDHFNGMFAFGIWDERSQTLFLARDRLGVKPLYFAEWNGTFAFASEIKALLKIPELPREVDWEALDLYFTYRIIPHPYTIFKTIRKLPPAHYLILKDGQSLLREYWDVHGPGELDADKGLTTKNGDLRYLRQELLELARDAVGMRLISDVPLGVLLSGGVDSTIVACLAAGQHRERLKTFTLGFLDSKGSLSSYDESATARLTAEYLQTEHQELLVTPDQIRETIPEVLDHCDEPFATSSSIPTYLLSRLARESVTVALSGDGPDEMFAGYRAYLLEPLSRIYLGIPSALRKFLIEPFLLNLPSSDATSTSRSIRRAHRFIRAFSDSPGERFFNLTNKFNDVPSGKIYSPSFRSLSLDLSKEIFRGHYEKLDHRADLINKMLYVDTKLKLADHILTKVDLMSMKVSLEVRSPFMDYRIAEFAFRLPGKLKINWFQKKRFLKDSFKGTLPPHVLGLPKRGFEIPVSQWLKDELRGMFLDVVAPPSGGGVLNQDLIQTLYAEHCANQLDHSEKLWILFVLRWWSRKNHIAI